MYRASSGLGSAVIRNIGFGLSSKARIARPTGVSATTSQWERDPRCVPRSLRCSCFRFQASANAPLLELTISWHAPSGHPESASSPTVSISLQNDPGSRERRGGLYVRFQPGSPRQRPRCASEGRPSGHQSLSTRWQGEERGRFIAAPREARLLSVHLITSPSQALHSEGSKRSGKSSLPAA